MIVRLFLNHEIKFLKKDAEWVVFLHGAGGSIHTWKKQIATFSEHFNLLLIDLRDHGESKNIVPSYQRYTFKIVSCDIKKLLDKLSIQKAHFVTLSFGSVLLQDFAERYPDLVAKVIFGGAIFSGGVLLRAFVYLAKFLNTFLSYPMMYQIFSFLLMPKKENQIARRLYQRQSLKISSKEYMKWVGLYKEFFQLLKKFKSQVLTFPSLIIMGGKDFMFLKSATKFSKAQEMVQLAMIPNTGHIANIESADAFNKLGVDFLKSQ